MASGTERLTKKERAALKRTVKKLALAIADKKERTQWMRIELERCAFKARHNRTRLRGLRVGALGMEDANERSKANAEISAIEREVDDALFTIAKKRSDVRRNAKVIKECEEKLQEARTALEVAGKK